MEDMYDFEPEVVREFLKERKIDKAAVQLPSGLRPHLGEIKSVFDTEDVDVIFLATSCYGACDLADKKAEELGCDALIHYGHSDMGAPVSLPTLYVETRIEAEPFEALEKALPKLKDFKWGLTATVQHVDYLDEVKNFLEKNSIEATIGEPGPRSSYPGQILGCDWGSAKSVVGEVDGFLYLGTGKFHPKGIALATGKAVFLINPVENSYEAFDLDVEDFLRKRAAVIEKAGSAESFGVLVSTKIGQNRLDLAEELKNKLLSAGYDSHILVTDEVTPEIMHDYQLEAYVNTACPRLPIDDAELYDFPILTPFETEVLLGEQDLDQYQLDEIGINFEVG